MIVNQTEEKTMSTEAPPPITPVEMSEQDIAFAERIAAKLGYSQTAYTSTSSLWGMFCLRDNPERSRHPGRMNCQVAGCIIKTVEFGFLFVATVEDLQLHDLHAELAGGTTQRAFRRSD
jgi:hypothetical protein